MKSITITFIILHLFILKLNAQDSLTIIENNKIIHENDSLIATGKYFKKVSNYSYYSFEFLNYHSDFNKEILNLNEDIIATGGSFNFSKMKIFKHLSNDYNLIKSEIFDNGILSQYSSHNTTINSFGNKEILNNFYFQLDYTIGIGIGYGWSLNADKILLINNTSGLNLGFTVKEIESKDNLIESTSEPTGISRDFFKSNLTYFFNKKFGMSLGITRFNTYSSFNILEGVASKTLETGTYYLVDEYLIDYMVKMKIDGIPIYNLLIQNLISYGIYSIKKNNDIFPFKGENGTLGFQYQIGFHFKY